MGPVIIYIFYVIKQYIIYSKNNIYYYKITNVIKYITWSAVLARIL